MSTSQPNHYAVLGLDPRCTEAQIRDAYRVLAKQHHPDLNHGSVASVATTQRLNAAYEILGDPERRRAYDREFSAREKPANRTVQSRSRIAQDVHLRIEEFFRGATLEVRVNDPSNPHGPEIYPLSIPPETAPGARFRVPRTAGAGMVIVRVKARPDFRFKVRGSDLRCDLRIRSERAARGGIEFVKGATGNALRVSIPARVARGQIIRIVGEGLPKPRGGRGDLLVRILYTPQVQVRRTGRR